MVESAFALVLWKIRKGDRLETLPQALLEEPQADNCLHLQFTTNARQVVTQKLSLSKRNSTNYGILACLWRSWRSVGVVPPRADPVPLRWLCIQWAFATAVAASDYRARTNQRQAASSVRNFCSDNDNSYGNGQTRGTTQSHRQFETTPKRDIKKYATPLFSMQHIIV